MKIIDEPYGVLLSREDMHELYKFFDEHMFIPKSSMYRERWDVYDKLVKLFQLFVEDGKDIKNK